MKALTLRCPWAYAITHLGKRVENRTWRPPPALQGQRIAIHAGKAPPVRANGTFDAGHEHWCEVQESLAWMTHKGLALMPVTARELVEAASAVVAVATLAEVVTQSQSPWFVGPFGWVLADVRALPAPIPCRGAQGLWDLPPDVLAQVQEAMS